MKYVHCALAIFMALALGSCKGNLDPSAKIAEIFESKEIVATLIVQPKNGENPFVYNETRSLERFSPASTFKIPNTLIALNNNVVESKTSVFKWDGVDRGLPRWNQDQTLESAFKVSCVWCYQEMAREIGTKRYEEALQALGYGNETIGDEVDGFWLNGVLQISAREKIDFLQKLSNRAIPYQDKHIEVLEDIMLVEQTADYSIYAKTGWALTTPQVAWYVGYIIKDEKIWLFAMNMRVDRPEQANLRKDLTMRSLKVLDII